MICESHAEANDKFLKFYDPNKSKLCIIYLDANYLHEPSIMGLLPNEILDWFNPEKADLDFYLSCFLKVDLDYPDALHNDNPSADEKIKVANGVLSQYQLQVMEGNDFPLGKNEKLFPNLGNRRK